VSRLEIWIKSSEDATRYAKWGGCSVLVFASMNVWGLRNVRYLSRDPSTALVLSHQARLEQLYGGLVALPLLGFMAWRVYRGKGWISATLATVWFVLEFALKIRGGTAPNIVLPLYIALVASLANATLACWWLRVHRFAYRTS
jgi:hypothetical protein